MFEGAGPSRLTKEVWVIVLGGVETGGPEAAWLGIVGAGFCAPARKSACLEQDRETGCERPTLLSPVKSPPGPALVHSQVQQYFPCH